jgi:hypothetical protein
VGDGAVRAQPVGAAIAGRGFKILGQELHSSRVRRPRSWPRVGEARPPPSSRRWAAGAQPGGQSFSCRREAHSHRSRTLSFAGSSSRHLDPLRGAIYLSKVQGKCFNCLASDHHVAQCHNTTKCWVCQRSGHISYGCPSRRSVSCTSRHRIPPSSNPTSPSPSHNLADVSLLDLLLGAMTPPPIQLLEPAEDPMRLEAELACCHVLQAKSGQDKVVLNDHSSFDVMAAKRQDAPVPSLIESVKLEDRDIQLSEVAQETFEDIQTPLMIRSEAEQSIGHHLIKALGIFNQNVVAPLSSSNLHTSVGKEVVSVSMRGNHRRSRKSKFKIKTQKPVVKVTRDMLTKKWIFTRRDKQLVDSPLKPIRSSSFEAIKKLSEVAMFMEALRKLTESGRSKTTHLPQFLGYKDIIR